ncbi:MAG: alpha/beta fold hydrolase [Planctomycetota bacterium]
MPFALRDGRRIHYTVEGDGPGVVLVPGLGSGARLFGTLPRRFARAGFTCAAVDPIGLEPSDPLPGDAFDFDAAAADVRAVVAALPAPRALVGTSLGGKVALRACAQDATAADRLVLLCSSAVVTARARRVYRMFELLCTEACGRWLGDLTAPFLFGATFLEQRAGVVDDIVRSMRPTAASREFMRRQAVALQSFSGRDDARACAVDALCLAGAEDTLTLPAEVEATAALMPRATCRTIAAAGHSLLLESAAAYDQVVAFLRG